MIELWSIVFYLDNADDDLPRVDPWRFVADWPGEPRVTVIKPGREWRVVVLARGPDHAIKAGVRMLRRSGLMEANRR